MKRNRGSRSRGRSGGKGAGKGECDRVRGAGDRVRGAGDLHDGVQRPHLLLLHGERHGDPVL